MTQGIKVTKAGKNINSTDIRDFILHSDYPMFKIHTISSGSITIATGETTGTTTISHNLGYVPAFLVYENNSLFPSDIDCYATTTGITITKKLSEPYNQTTTTYEASEAFWEDSTENYRIIAGDRSGNNDGSAVRFTNIALTQGQTIVSAYFKYKYVSTTSGPDIKFKIWGIDEDNTSAFGDPMGRPKTDAVNTKQQAALTGEFDFGDSWTNLAQEIVNRPGWSSGNAMGFLFNDNGTDDNKVMAVEKADFSLSNITLTIKKNGSSSSLVTNYKVVVFKDKIHS